MSQFPEEIYTPIEKENLNGLVRDVADVKNLYAEDYNEATAEIVAIEETLGTEPQGAYASVKAWLTALASALSGKQDSLGFTAENVANKSTNVSTDGASDTKYPSVKSVKTYADSLVAGLLDLRGAYDASGNAYPSSGGSGSAGAILKGDLWLISVAGTLGGVAVQVGDSLIALVDSPSTTSSNWSVLNSNISFVPEDVANKDTDGTLAANSDTKYASQKAVKTYIDVLRNIIKVSSGNVGIGTSSPQTIFHLKQGNATFLLEDSGQGSADSSRWATQSAYIGAGNSAYRLRAVNDAYSDGANAMVFNRSGITITGMALPFFGAGALTSDASGNITSVSDERIKNILGNFKRGLQDILKIEPILFRYNRKSGLDEKNIYAGFSAQNVKKYIPEAIGIGQNGFYSFNDIPVLATLLNAVKEQNSRIEFLELQVKKLCVQKS